MADWQTALETVAAAYARGTLEKDARTISEAYRLKTGEGRRLLTRKSEAAAYALSRMPATVEAAKAALTEALAATGLAPKTLLDCGAGTGAVTFAADALLGLERPAADARSRRRTGGVGRVRFDGEGAASARRAGVRGLYARRAGSFHAAACGRETLGCVRTDARAHRAGHAAGVRQSARRSGSADRAGSICRRAVSGRKRSLPDDGG